MRWLDRLRSRLQGYAPRRVGELVRAGARVELEGQIEALTQLEDPLEGAPAVVLRYRARSPGISQRYFGIPDDRGTMEGFQATDFVLRDASGAALIQVERGGDLGELHRRLHAEFGIGLQVELERLAAGDTVRVRGHVRELVGGGSPHRREPWSVVVVAEELLSF